MKAHDKLKQRQNLLRAEIVRREENMQHLADQLENNFGRVVINSVLPLSEGKRHSLGSTLETTSNLVGKLIGTSGGFGKYDVLIKSAQMIATGMAWKYIKKLFK